MIDVKTIPSLPISRIARKKLKLSDDFFDERGFLMIRSRREARELSILYRDLDSEGSPPASDLYGAACILTAWRLLLEFFSHGPDPYEKGALDAAGEATTADTLESALLEIIETYPDNETWKGLLTPGEALKKEDGPLNGTEELIRRWTLTVLSEENPAFRSFGKLFTSGQIFPLWKSIDSADNRRPPREPEDAAPLASLRKPIEAAPNSVKDQLLYILNHWGSVLGEWAGSLIGALDMIEEETRPRFEGPGPVQSPGFTDLSDDETARFSQDDNWMPRVVLVAKNVLVWLNQLSKTYGRTIDTLDAIPDEELSMLAARGFNALWLIGLWERSNASREIKQRMGNSEAAASAYSLYGYDIAEELGGWTALENLRIRGESHGIRLSSDMVPNHVGLDSDWVRHHPERLLSSEICPYPAYRFNSDNLSQDEYTDIRLEDHYWDHSDAAVVFKRTNRQSGETIYVYHGNDGTTMPWNDTAQIDFLNPEAREAVIQDILHVAANFPIIRFDAAMVLARKHIRRLWFPAPGAGGAIPSRSEYALSEEEFAAACPTEFWREVVDRVASEVPGTLLLAEAFWMMEGYFVRSLGMHRVYNSAFMNMLRDQKNREYRDIIKETLAFDPGILQRYVNFMNNPDEETAIEQFGNDDRYFAVCTLLATLPGLPMFGHGQIEGLSEKYGMEYVRAYKDENPDANLITRHAKEIFPLLARRSLFSGAFSFRLYDLVSDNRVVEDIFIYSNSEDGNRALVIVNNAYEKAMGIIHQSAPMHIGDMKILNETLYSALGLSENSGNDWLLMKDFISGLWYLRSSNELKSEGLSVMVDGFGRQVFMDFRHEKESADGLWGKLAKELAGSGILDPDAAITEIRLRPIHSLLDSLFAENLVDRLAKSIHRGKRPDRVLKETFSRNSFTSLLSRLKECHKNLNPENMNSGTTGHSEKEITKMVEKRLLGSCRNFRFFGGGVRRKLNRYYASSEWKESEFLAVWSILSSLSGLMQSPQTIWDSWGLEKWLFKGNFSGITNRINQPLRIALSTNFEILENKKPGEILSTLMSNPVVRDSCGINEWDNVLWYTREGWSITLRALFLSAAAETKSGRKQRKRLQVLKKLIKKWYLADKTAEYHVDRLLHAAR